MTEYDYSDISGRKQAERAGWLDGIECASVAIQESDDPPTSETDPGWRHWNNHANEASSTLRVPERWRRVYELAYQRGARSSVKSHVRRYADD